MGVSPNPTPQLLGLNSQSMAGLSKVADESALDCFKTLQKLNTDEFWLDLEPGSKGYVKGGEKAKLKCLFNQSVYVFLKETCGSHCVRPLPPMLGNGQSVDLFKLYFVVREKGGYETVSENGLWDSVAKESWLDSGVASALKLIYLKYLDTLDTWLQRIVKDKDSKGGLEDSGTNQSVFSMDLEPDLTGLFSEITDQKKKDGEHLHIDLEESKLNFTNGGQLCKGGEVQSFTELDEGKENVGDKGSVDAGKRESHFESSVVEKDGFNQKKCKGNEGRSFVELDGDKENGNDKRSADDGKHGMDFELNVVKEDGYNQKRKRECYSAFLDWVAKVAKDPCDPAIGSLPEMSKWKSCGNEQLWKQVLLAREAMLLKRNADSSAEQSIWQKKQKMHPTMYEDHSGFERSRCSQRLLSAKESRALLSFSRSQVRACSESSSGTQSDLEDRFDRQSDPLSENSLIGLWVNNHSRKRIPVGSYFQTKVPEWTGVTYESDSKWHGTRFWPQEKGQYWNNLIERDRIGKGRQDSCGCQFQASLECVRFHVAEKRRRVKLELGLAFYHWHIDKMGEEVALSWAQEEEKKFEAIVRSNPLAQEKCFWDELFKHFPYKSRGQLVSYYFNVFLLQRRGYQNRSIPSEINSDDDEPEFGLTTNGIGQGAVKSPGSIYCSPKKAHLNFREYSKVD